MTETNGNAQAENENPRGTDAAQETPARELYVAMFLDVTDFLSRYGKKKIPRAFVLGRIQLNINNQSRIFEEAVLIRTQDKKYYIADISENSAIGRGNGHHIFEAWRIKKGSDYNKASSNVPWVVTDKEEPLILRINSALLSDLRLAETEKKQRNLQTNAPLTREKEEERIQGLRKYLHGGNPAVFTVGNMELSIERKLPGQTLVDYFYPKKDTTQQKDPQTPSWKSPKTWAIFSQLTDQLDQLSRLGWGYTDLHLGNILFDPEVKRKKQEQKQTPFALASLIDIDSSSIIPEHQANRDKLSINPASIAPEMLDKKGLTVTKSTTVFQLGTLFVDAYDCKANYTRGVFYRELKYSQKSPAIYQTLDDVADIGAAKEKFKTLNPLEKINTIQYLINTQTQKIYCQLYQDLDPLELDIPKELKTADWNNLTETQTNLFNAKVYQKAQFQGLKKKSPLLWDLNLDHLGASVRQDVKAFIDKMVDVEPANRPPLGLVSVFFNTMVLWHQNEEDKDSLHYQWRKIKLERKLSRLADIDYGTANLPPNTHSLPAKLAPNTHSSPASSSPGTAVGSPSVASSISELSTAVGSLSAASSVPDPLEQSSYSQTGLDVTPTHQEAQNSNEWKTILDDLDKALKQETQNPLEILSKEFLHKVNSENNEAVLHELLSQAEIIRQLNQATEIFQALLENLAAKGNQLKTEPDLSQIPAEVLAAIHFKIKDNSSEVSVKVRGWINQEMSLIRWQHAFRKTTDDQVKNHAFEQIQALEKKPKPLLFNESNPFFLNQVLIELKKMAPTPNASAAREDQEPSKKDYELRNQVLTWLKEKKWDRDTLKQYKEKKLQWIFENELKEAYQAQSGNALIKNALLSIKQFTGTLNEKIDFIQSALTRPEFETWRADHEFRQTWFKTMDSILQQALKPLHLGIRKIESQLENIELALKTQKLTSKGSKKLEVEMAHLKNTLEELKKPQQKIQEIKRILHKTSLTYYINEMKAEEQKQGTGNSRSWHSSCSGPGRFVSFMFPHHHNGAKLTAAELLLNVIQNKGHVFGGHIGVYPLETLYSALNEGRLKHLAAHFKTEMTIIENKLKNSIRPDQR